MAAALLAFSLLTLVLFFPLVRELDATVLLKPADASSAARDYWAAEQQGETIFTLTRDRYIYAPEGQARSPALQVANAVQPAFVVALEEVVGFLGALNLYLLAGFALSAAAMFALLLRLGLRPVACVVGAVAFAFSWWQYEQALFGHAAHTHLWIFPVITYAFLRLRERTTVVRGAVLGVTLALAFYLSSYLGLIGSFLLLALMATDVVMARRDWRSRLVPFAAAWLVAVAALFPPMVVAYVGSAPLTLPTAPGVGEYHSAQIRSFLVPSEHHPLFGRRFENWAPRRGGENVLFPGYTVIALAVLGLALGLREFRASPGTHRLYMLRAAALFVPLGIFLSLPANFTVAGWEVPLPTPPRLIGGLVGWWRIYSRLGVIAIFGLALLAAFAAHLLLRRRRRPLQLVLAIAIAGLAIELVPGLPVPTYHLERSRVDAWLAAHPGGTVAVYPMVLAFEEGVAGSHEWDDHNWSSFYAQRHHGHPLFARPIFPAARSPNMSARLLARDLQTEDAVAILQALSVRYVVVHDDLYRRLGRRPPRFLRPNVRLVAKLPGIRIAEVRPATVDLERVFRRRLDDIANYYGVPSPSLRLGRGFLPVETYHGVPSRWMTQNGELRVSKLSDDPDVRYRLRFRGFSNRILRRVELLAPDDTVLTRFLLGTSEQEQVTTTFRLRTTKPTRLRLRAVPDPTPFSEHVRRRASIFVITAQLEPIMAWNITQ